MLIRKAPDVEQKLDLLSRDSMYDLACACATRGDEHRRRSKDGKWIYPVSLPSGGRTFLFKTLLSNECANNCRYCPLRAGSDSRRLSITPEEMAGAFFDYYRKGRVSGLFLSSGVKGGPDNAMERINTVALHLRRRGFRGYIHLKVLPGASDQAIRQAVGLASAVSINIETPGEENFRLLSTTKKYAADILRPIKLISRLTARGSCRSGVKQTTQFVVGASKETDNEIIRYAWKLYKGLKLSRVYFSAYQRGAGSPDLPGERSGVSNEALLGREHRLYQTDWLIRKYGFRADEIPLCPDGNLSLDIDPKEMWAKAHPEFFPVYVNRDGRERLLRVPGLGETAVNRIMEYRKSGRQIRALDVIGRKSKLLVKASDYLAF